MRAALGAALLCLAGALVLAGAGGRGGHPDRPPPAHTGGFGEPTCHACHFDFAPEYGPGRLTLSDMPDAAETGATYEIRPAGPVHFHAAALAGDGDLSPLGDYVYAAGVHTSVHREALRR